MPGPRAIRLVVEYDGAAYGGWQLQPNAPTIQGCLERAVEAVTGAFARVNGASRTDSGVHALGQVAVFRTESAIPPAAFARALNAHLPKDISVRCSDEVPLEFSPRHDARGKRYVYRIDNAPTRPALDRARAWWCTWRLDDAALADAARQFVGEHDFTAFAAVGDSGGGIENPVRTITRSEWLRCGHKLSYVVEGTAFLYKMVRCMVGTMVEVGRGSMRAGDIPAILASRDHARTGPTAPPCGLVLARIEYPERPFPDAAFPAEEYPA